ncbi:hypothetical protein [Streptomyces sp. NPDC088270]
MSAAEDFLRDHVDLWGDTNVPMVLGDPKECWCWDDDAQVQEPISDA